MNTDTIKQQLARARGAYTMGTVDRETLDDALNIIEKEVAGATQALPVNKPIAEAFSKSPPATAAAAPTMANPVPEQVGKPFKPGGDVQRPQPNQTTRNRP